jgi:hypothetical protein
MPLKLIPLLSEFVLSSATSPQTGKQSRFTFKRYDSNTDFAQSLPETDPAAARSILDMPPNTPGRLLPLTKIASGEKAIFFALYNENLLVATATLTQAHGASFMSEISVRKGYEGRQCAQQVMRALFDYAQKNDITLIANVQDSGFRATMMHLYPKLHAEFPKLQITYTGQKDAILGSTPYAITNISADGLVTVKTAQELIDAHRNATASASDTQALAQIALRHSDVYAIVRDADLLKLKSKEFAYVNGYDEALKKAAGLSTIAQSLKFSAPAADNL